MVSYSGKHVLVVGPGNRGLAVCRYLLRHGGTVSVLRHGGGTVGSECEASLAAAGVKWRDRPEAGFDFAVVDSGVPLSAPAVEELRQLGVPLLWELEFGVQQLHCLCIAVTGTNGKSTASGIIREVLEVNHRKTIIAGHEETPVCSVVEDSKELDYLVLKISSAQLESNGLFRPAVAVLLNSGPDDPGRFPNPEVLLHTYGRIFQKQQVFDWAIIQNETLYRLQRAGIPVPSKIITFSGTDPQADIYYDRGLIQSRLGNWTGPLLNLDQCGAHGYHAAEEFMAALAVGHVLRLPLDRMVEGARRFVPELHRFSVVAEHHGITFVDDSEATNVEALEKALWACKQGGTGQSNVVLIAGGADRGASFHDVGPLISRRVKHAFLMGESSEKIRAAWSLFTPCTLVQSLLEAVREAAKIAVPGDVVLLSPACSSFDQFHNFAERGEVFCKAVKSISGGAAEGSPHIDHRNSAAA